LHTQNYTRETQTVLFQGKSITVTHLTPVLNPDEREKRKREIEGQLYDVFIKYAGQDQKNRRK